MMVQFLVRPKPAARLIETAARLNKQKARCYGCIQIVRVWRVAAGQDLDDDGLVGSEQGAGAYGFVLVRLVGQKKKHLSVIIILGER
jgi:hypothetical protein